MMTLAPSKCWRPAALALVLVSITGLSACGLTGDLKRGKPIFGEPKSETKPADLPESEKNSLPPLPPRPDAKPAEPDADDELLGGPA
jgi:hypothetical protein